MDNRAKTDRTPAPNSGLAKVAVQCSADTFAVNLKQLLTACLFFYGVCEPQAVWQVAQADTRPKVAALCLNQVFAFIKVSDWITF